MENSKKVKVKALCIMHTDHPTVLQVLFLISPIFL